MRVWGDLDAWFRTLILCAAVIGLAGGLGSLKDARSDVRPRARKRRAQLWRYLDWSIALALIIVTEVVRLNKPVNWHTWGDALVTALAVVAVVVEGRT